MINYPKVSVIVAVYNGGKTFEACLKSIQKQLYKNIEIIIIDGGSTDNTMQIVVAYKDMIKYCESKKDKGIYHAWNKALQHVTGEWVCFLGSDDEFSYTDAISDMVRLSQESGCNFISGKMEIISSKGAILKGDPWDIGAMRKWQNIAHPGALHHQVLFEQFGHFNEAYKIAGDYDFLLRASESIKSCFLDKVLVHMGADGVSNTQILPVLTETFHIQRKHRSIGVFQAGVNFVIACLKALVRKAI